MRARFKRETRVVNTHISPFFSVIITTYNRANLISRALDSLLAQTETDWEAVIVDDESHDDTYCRIVPYLKTSHNIVYLRQPHSGESTAKNSGIDTASGKFITFLDSDDEFDPYHLESRKTFLKDKPEIKFLHGGVTILGNQYVPDRFNINKNIHLNECVIGGTFFIERETAISMNGFRDISIGTDADLYDRLQNAGLRIHKISHPTYIYHHETEDSITNKLLAAS